MRTAEVLSEELNGAFTKKLGNNGQRSSSCAGVKAQLGHLMAARDRRRQCTSPKPHLNNTKAHTCLHLQPHSPFRLVQAHPWPPSLYQECMSTSHFPGKWRPTLQVSAQIHLLCEAFSPSRPLLARFQSLRSQSRWPILSVLTMLYFN